MRSEPGAQPIRWGTFASDVDFRETPPVWHRLWRRRGPPSDLPTLSGHVTALAIAADAVTGQPCAAIASSGGDVVVLDVMSRRAIGPVLRIGPWINGIDIAHLEDRQVVVAVETRGPLHVLDPITGEERAPVLTSDTSGSRRYWSLACVRVQGRPIAITGTSVGELMVTDLLSLRNVLVLRTSPIGSGISHLRIHEVDGEPRLISGNFAGDIAVWHLEGSADSLALRLARHWKVVGDGSADQSVSALATAKLEGRAVVLAAAGTMVRGWELESGQPLGPAPAAHRSTIRSLVPMRFGDAPAALLGGDDGLLHVWDPSTGSVQDRPLRTPIPARLTEAVWSSERGLLVSGGTDGRLAIWNPSAEPDSDQAVVDDAWWSTGDHPTRVLVTDAGEQRIAVVGFSGGDVRLFNTGDGAQLGGPRQIHHADIFGIAPLQLEGRRVIVTAGVELVLHDLDSGATLRHLAQVDANTVAAAVVDGRQVLVVGTRSGALLRLDPLAMQPIGAPMTGHRGQVWTIATCEVAGRPVALSAANGGKAILWDLGTGRPIQRDLLGDAAGTYAATIAFLAGQPFAFAGGESGAVEIVHLADVVNQRPWLFRTKKRATTALYAGGTVTALTVAVAGLRAWLIVGISSRAADGSGCGVLWYDATTLGSGEVPVQRLSLIGVVDTLATDGDRLIIGGEEGLLAYQATLPPEMQTIGPYLA